jgi:intracellular sulfur oxidation DsrE/DsrF family protein
VVNVYKARLEGLVTRGVRLAVCDMASHRFAGAIARKIDGNADAIYKEMTANLVGNARFVAAGIIAVNRAQERGYSISYTG